MNGNIEKLYKAIIILIDNNNFNIIINGDNIKSEIIKKTKNLK